jgi:hypothetical protein
MRKDRLKISAEACQFGEDTLIHISNYMLDLCLRRRREEKSISSDKSPKFIEEPFDFLGRSITSYKTRR